MTGQVWELTEATFSGEMVTYHVPSIRQFCFIPKPFVVTCNTHSEKHTDQKCCSEQIPECLPLS